MFKNILIVTPNLNAGGAQKNLIRITRVLSKKNNVSFLAINNNGFYKDTFLKLKCKKLSLIEKKYKILKIYEFWKNLRINDYDYVISGMYYFNIIFLVFFKLFVRKKTKIIIRETAVLSNIKKPFIINFLYSKFLRKAFLIISQSNDMTMDLVSNYGINFDQISQIENPIEKPKRIKTKNNKNDYFLIVGRLEKEKNIYEFLKFYDSTNLNFKIKIIGEGSELKKILTLVNNTGLKKIVKIEKFKTNLEKDYLNAIALILPSIVEGMPNVALEAMSYGLPVISNKFKGGINQIIDNKINGCIINLFEKNKLIDTLKSYSKLKINSKNISNNITKLFHISDFESKIQKIIT